MLRALLTQFHTVGPLRRAAALSVLFVVHACGGGGGDSAPPAPVNQPPVSNAGVDRTVFESTTANLNGSGSDADGDTLSYSWSQTAGQAVTIDNASSASASFSAPDVAAGSPEILTFALDVNDGTTSRSDTVNITVEENEPPVASAGPDRDVIENTQVTLDASASSDANSTDTLSYQWSQTGGVAVTLSGGDTAEPEFTAPDVLPATTEVLDFQVLVSDGVNSASDSVTITVTEGNPIVTISGTISYEFVPPTVIADYPYCRGLNFLLTETRPVRGATVQLIDAGSAAVLAATTSDENGAYSFPDTAALTDVRLRVRAELKRSGSPSWDIDVRDNVDLSASPPPLPDRPLYVLDGAEFNTGGSDQVRNLTATTGWGGASYTGPRAAAPFAVLDAIYSAIEFVLSADPNAAFQPLDAYWSVNNKRVAGGGTDIDAINSGELGATFYTSDPDFDNIPNPSLFLWGDVDTDTMEFDDDVVVHEWGHFFEDTLSRSDSVGGAHALGQTLDARVAFGEGWATALAAMALGDPQTCDTGRPGTTEGFGINAESSNFGRQGWYNETSVTTFIYDLFDTIDDGTDTDSIGFQPIFDTLVGPQAGTAAFTTIFSFAAELRGMLGPQHQAFLDSQLARENIASAGLDIWGSTETNDAGGNRDVLPIYTAMTADGSIVNICTNSDFDRPERTGNKLGENRFIRLSVPVTDTYNVVVTATTATPVTPDPDDRDQSDPDIYIYRDGVLVAVGRSGEDNSEAFETQNTLAAGATYAVFVEEWRYDDEEGAPDDYPEQICFDVSFTATP